MKLLDIWFGGVSHHIDFYLGFEMFLEMHFLSLSKGLVRHGTRHSLKVLPKFYRSQFDSCRPVEVTTLDFSPFGEPLFLVKAA